MWTYDARARLERDLARLHIQSMVDRKSSRRQRQHDRSQSSQAQREMEKRRKREGVSDKPSGYERAKDSRAEAAHSCRNSSLTYQHSFQQADIQIETESRSRHVTSGMLPFLRSVRRDHKARVIKDRNLRKG